MGRQADVMEPMGPMEPMPLVELVVPGARFNDIIRSVDPAFVILETLLLSPDFLLPFQACLMNALRLQLRDGSHPFRWLFIDEYNKMAENAVMIEFNREQGQERLDAVEQREGREAGGEQSEVGAAKAVDEAGRAVQAELGDDVVLDRRRGGGGEGAAPLHV